MILIPAWIISLLTIMVAIDTLIRYRRERNLLLLGKIASWGLASVIYLLIAFEFFDIENARAFSRWAWLVVPLTELTYRYAKIRWKI
jgi:hypothetical protein